MRDNEPSGCAVVLLMLSGFIFGLILGLMLGIYGAQDARQFEQQRAIEAGVGKWVIDAQTGERRFEYGR